MNTKIQNVSAFMGRGDRNVTVGFWRDQVSPSRQFSITEKRLERLAMVVYKMQQNKLGITRPFTAGLGFVFEVGIGAL